MKPTTNLKPIAYRNGHGGGIFHPDCWHQYANEYFLANGARSLLGTLYYPAARHKELKNMTCGRCGKPF